ncbi:MAG: ABC transporter permease [Acetobacteraceae bacterium]|nr:ABC transporter permease [Acetobacteraceae bacterium]
MRRAGRLLARRLFGALPVLGLVAIGGFLLLEAAPGDAVDAYLAGIGGGDAAQVAALRAEWGLDGGPLPRLAAYLGALLRLDLGWSTAFERPVLAVVLERLPNTLLLMGMATLLALSLGSLLGIVCGARPGSPRDRALSLAAIAIYAMPGFWLGLVLIVGFSVRLRWLPSGGIETVASGLAGWDRAADIARHLVLPVASLGLVYMALYLRLMRDGMAELWRQDFVRAARARGMAGPRLVLRHVARNALLPVVTMLGLQSAAMLGGSVVIESVFAIPGLGRLAAEAVARRDTPLLLGVMLLSAVVVILVNLAVDLAYALLDPRVGSGTGG